MLVLAHSADPAPFGDPGVLWRVLVPCRTVGPLGPIASASAHVLCVSYGFEMSWVHAGRDPTKVVELESFGDWAN
jgi:hypothetical protein